MVDRRPLIPYSDGNQVTAVYVGGDPVSLAQIAFFVGGALMLLDALLYSLGALPRLRRVLAPSDDYWARRLLLNLLLANAGLYLTALFTLVGAYLASPLVMGVAVLACAYSVATVRVFTPKDWPHAVPRAVGGVLILVGLLLR
jgi:hypothetical protein